MTEPARLIGASRSIAPAVAEVEWVTGHDGLRLRAAVFPTPGARGSVIVSPGRTEPIEKYLEVVCDLQGRGFTVLVHDWRGHGLSARLHKDPLRGHARGWRPFLKDYDALLAAFERRLPQPWIGLGHSMGGGLTALAMLHGETRLSAAVLSAPMMGVHLGKAPRWLAVLLSRVATTVGCAGCYVAKSDPLAPFEGNLLTHDRGRFERTLELLTGAPELQVGGVTWAWLDFALSLSARLAEDPADDLTAPIVIVAAGQERLVDNRAMQAFAERIPNGRYLELAGASHEILMETDPVREQFWQAFDETAAKVLGG